MSEILVIINPAARSARARDVWKRLGVLPENAMVAATSAPGEARELAAQAAADGYRTVVAVGGPR